MRLAIFVTDEAEVQIKNAIEWYEEQQPSLGRKFVFLLKKLTN